MAGQGLTTPAGFGGLMRYNTEYKSKIMLEPKHVIILIILVILFVISLNIFWPINSVLSLLF
jgi:preprotein translocase subunit Sec61beta